MHENSVCCLYYYITLISAYNVVSHENDDDGLIPQKMMAIIILKYVCVGSVLKKVHINVLVFHEILGTELFRILVL